MVTGITERNKIKAELTGLGYSMKYIDDWQPKTTLYRHREAYNDEGNVTDAVGTSVSNVPGNPDYVLRKSKIGLFPWAPGESCECQWCAETSTERSEEPVVSNTVEVQDSKAQAAKVDCPVCDYVAEGASLAGARSRLRAHAKGH